jgi:hypothetical protein
MIRVRTWRIHGQPPREAELLLSLERLEPFALQEVVPMVWRLDERQALKQRPERRVGCEVTVALQVEQVGSRVEQPEQAVSLQTVSLQTVSLQTVSL